MSYYVVAQSDAFREKGIDWSFLVEECTEFAIPLTNRQKTILNKTLINETIEEILSRLPDGVQFLKDTGQVIANEPEEHEFHVETDTSITAHGGWCAPYDTIDTTTIFRESMAAVRRRATEIERDLFGDNVQLSKCVEILGVNTSAAESALRYAGIRTGYPLHLVERLRDSRRR